MFIAPASMGFLASLRWMVSGGFVRSRNERPWEILKTFHLLKLPHCSLGNSAGNGTSAGLSGL